jgi:hypothetical protein
MHSSVLGVGGHFDYPEKDAAIVGFNYFDLPTDHSIVTNMYLTFDTHIVILKIFRRILDDRLGGEGAVWDVRINGCEVRLERLRKRWSAVVPNPLQEPIPEPLSPP